MRDLEKEVKMNNPNCICNALIELITLQDLINESQTPYFGNLLSKLVGVDTIPFFLFTADGQLKFKGVDKKHKEGCEERFESGYFRIEAIDKISCCATISLLRPFNLCGEDTELICDTFKLRKTSTCVQVDMNCICGIQCLDTELLKRKVIIEPKW